MLFKNETLVECRQKAKNGKRNFSMVKIRGGLPKNKTEPKNETEQLTVLVLRSITPSKFGFENVESSQDQ
ncbi:hypothetical protein ABN254_21460, partial [Providencia rettgeri]